MKMFLLTFTIIFFIIMSGYANSDPREEDVLNLDQLTDAFGWNFEEAEIQTQMVAEGLYVLFGLGGNIAVSIGKDGVLIVDDQFPPILEIAASSLSII